MAHGHRIPLRMRADSDPYSEMDQALTDRKEKSVFPKLYDFCGYLDIHTLKLCIDQRTRPTKPWKRKYFVLANNFLLMASTPFSTKLEKVIPLEGTNIKTTTKTSHLSFEILVRKKRNQFRAPNEHECNSWTERIQRASRLKIRDIYHFDALLGTNASGSTKVLSAKHRVTGEEVAVKVISKREYNSKMLSNEVLILKRLDHPHVVKLYDLFETKKNVYLVLEKCRGGELFEQIANLSGGGGFTEKECITVMHQIAKAVKYMHSMGIVHRDLKPENILCVEPGSIQNIKIADFGISKVIFNPEERRKEKEERRRLKKQRERTIKLQREQLRNPNGTVDDEKLQELNKGLAKTRKHKGKKSNKRFIDPLARNKGHDRRRSGNYGANSRSKGRKQHQKKPSDTFRKKYDVMDTMCGTISYTAPEILKERPYDKRVDYWSLGVIAFILLCGYPPFWGDTEYDVANSILNSDVILDEEDWSHVSDNGKRLVLGLLERSPHRRLTVDDILKHTWTYANKSFNAKASKSFVATVAMRRIRKSSMGVFETDSKKMNYLYRHHRDNDGHSRKRSGNNQYHHRNGSQTGDHQPHHRNGSSYGSGYGAIPHTRPRRIENAASTSTTSIQSESMESEHSLRSVISPLSGASPSPMQRNGILPLEAQMSESFSYSNMTLGSYDRGDSMSLTDIVRRYSKTDDDLFELRLPHNMSCTPRDYAMDDGFFAEDDDDGIIDLNRSRSISMRRQNSR